MHTNKPALFNEPRNKNRALQRVQTLRTFQKENVNGKRKNGTNRIMTNNKGYPKITTDQQASYEL
jgi:hypothetical protein